MKVQFYDGNKSLEYNASNGKIKYYGDIQNGICYVKNLRDYRYETKFGKMINKPLINRYVYICITFEKCILCSIEMLTGKVIEGDCNVMLAEALKITDFHHKKNPPLTKTAELVRNPLRNLVGDDTSNERWSNKKLIQEDRISGLWSKLDVSYRGGEIMIEDCTKNILFEELHELDIKSDYPFLLLTRKFPVGKPRRYHSTVIDNTDNYAYLFKFSCDNLRSKADKIVKVFAASFRNQSLMIDPEFDSNKKLIRASHFECYMNETDLALVKKYYKFDNMELSDFYVWEKNYLPDYFRKFVYDNFILKEVNGDEVAKTTLNSIYGVCVCSHYLQAVKEGKSTVTEEREPWSFAWGIWCTSYGRELQAELIETFGGIYSPIDCVITESYNENDLLKWNERVKNINEECGYGPVLSSKDNKYHYIGELIHEVDKDVYIKGINRYIKNGHTVVGGMPRREITVEEFINLYIPDKLEYYIEREYY